MKNYKKIFYVIFVMIGVFLIQEPVYAKAPVWEYGDDETVIQNLKEKYPDRDFCLYKVPLVWDTNSTNWNTTYGRKPGSGTWATYIFSYLADNPSSGTFVPDLIKLSFVKYDSSLTTINNPYVWKSKFFGSDYKINFDSELKNYLVRDNKLSCERLYFYEENNILTFMTEESFQSEKFYPCSSGVDKAVCDRIEESSNIGQLYMSKIHQCKDEFNKMTTIIQNYDNQYEELKYDFSLYNISGDINTASDIESLTKATNILTDMMELTEQTLNDINAIGLTTISSKSDEEGICKTAANTKKQAINDLQSTNRELNNLLADLKNKKKEAEVRKENGELTVSDSTLDEFDNAIETSQEAMENINKIYEELLKNINFGASIGNGDCEGILGEGLLNDIKTVLTWIRIAVPIILIVLGSMDFIKAILSDDQQELKKATSRFVKRCVIAVAIFFIPGILMYLISFIDKIADVSCDVRLW